MPRIDEHNDICTVIVTVDAAPEIVAGLAAHASVGLERFLDFPGFVGGALHLSRDRGRIVQYLQWDSEAEYRACIDDPVWDEVESTRIFMEAVRSGRATLDARTYRVDTVRDAAAGDGAGPSVS